MRTLYFLEPGQKLNDTKPSERKRALLVSKQEWDKFGDHLVRKHRIAEEKEREKEDLENRKMASKEMAKTWDNTIINIRKRRIEKHRNQIAQLEKDRRRRFLEMRKEEEDNKKRVIEEARRLLRQEKDNAKSLISALRFSEVLREREEQIKFEKKLQNIENEREKEYAAKLKSDAEEYKLELQNEKEQKYKKMAELNKEVRKEMAEFIKRKEELQQSEIELEIQDNMRVLEEIKEIEENEKKEKERKKQIIIADILENRKMIAEFEAQCKLEREEEEAAIHIHAETKKRIAKIKKEKEKDEAKANQMRREKISAAVAAKAADKETEENRIIQKAVAEREAREKELIEKKKIYQQQLVDELNEERKHQLVFEEEKKYQEKELLKLSMMQRLKNDEVNAEFTQQMRKDKKDKFKSNRNTWDKQCEEIKAVRAAERAEDVDAVARAVECWNLDDKHFLEYAENVLEESKSKNRLLLPMQRYIEKFKKEVGITRFPKQHKLFISKVPINNKLYECPAARKKTVDTWPNENDRKSKPLNNIFE
ncbi:cilia- and flagella- associated protein 210-like [Macrosteles quadrilineatus]|uniref:cilia- and flagella- associated protein 210-like n=1 Tax=Macrosteles quadrilineatus TaxID=74068 RepID=UPI0023E1DCB7|nr:cilia- and flagella- associated protein 210-like [Macrosteles quadrilineatus]